MQITIELENISPLEFFGVQGSKLNLIAAFFPKLKISQRGNTIHAQGEGEILEAFEKKITELQNYADRYNSLPAIAIEKIMQGEAPKNNDEVIVYSSNGSAIRARTAKQQQIVDGTGKNDMLFVIGPAGTGKTYTSVALAVRALKNHEVRRIILTRPAVEAGENLGFLPGDMKEKLDPYMQPLYDALRDMIQAEKLASYMEKGVIQIAPLAFMRGRTLDNAFVILDEAQNTTSGQMLMFLTRMGLGSKFIITGDPDQADLPARQASGLSEAKKLLESINDIGFVQLTDEDIVRHGLVKKIIRAYKER